MREIAPARERAFFHDLKSSQTKCPSPVVFHLKRAGTSASAPLSIVCPAHHAIPPEQRNIFVNDREALLAQHAVHFVKHESRILRVVQYVAKQNRIEALISNGKVPAVVWQIVDARGSAVADVQSNYGRAEHASKMMRDEAVSATHVEYVRTRRQHTRDFERHVVCSPNFSATAHSVEATFNRGG